MAAAIAAAAVGVGVRRPASAPTPLPKRFVVALPDIDRLVDDWGPALVLVPDGSGFAYVGQRGGDRRIYLHTLADGASRPLLTTEGGLGPFFSPDGKWMGFVQDGKLKKMAVAGGPSTVIGGALVTGGAGWGSDDRIVFGGQDGLWQVPASGGRPERLTQLDAAHGEAEHIGPRILPGGKAVLFTVLNKTGTAEDAAVAVVSLRGGGHRILVRGGSSAHYASNGHLVYVRATDLLVAPFDAERLTITGSPALAVAAVRTTPQFLVGHFDVSSDGTLVYFAGGGAEQRTLAWLDLTGTVRPVPLPARPYMHPSLLPGERGVIVEIEDTPHNIWHGDLRSGVMTRLTHEGGNHRPVLSPDGRLMVFSSDRTVPRSLFLQPTDGSGTAEHLLEAPHPHNAESWSPDGRHLAFLEIHPETGGDIWLLPFEGERQPRPFLKTPFDEYSAVFSPDGRWLAYVSNESGRYEVLITAFPGPGPRKQVSTGGGATPVFSHDGRNLYYQMGDQVLAAGIVADPELTTSAPRVAFELPPPRTAAALPNFAVSLAGDSILTVKTLETPGTPKVHVVLNWFEELRRTAP